MTKEKQRRRRFVYGDGSEGRCNEKNGSNVNSLDLLEMNIGIRMNHALKDASEKYAIR